MKPRYIFQGVIAFTFVTVLGVMLNITTAKSIKLPSVVRIAAGEYSYRPAGVFYIGTRVVDAPIELRTARQDFEIMKNQVSQSQYAQCVLDGACSATLSKGSTNIPQVNVSYIDAVAYARWFSKKTQQLWRLPTDAEWTRAAGDRFSEVLIGTDTKGADPSQLWLEKYRNDAASRGGADPTLRDIGSFGENDLGLVDINGNVWEWTETCFQNGKVSEDGLSLISTSWFCGVRVAQGKHRAFIIDFVRDAKGGGCAVGIPPDNLGFRLVRIE